MQSGQVVKAEKAYPEEKVIASKMDKKISRNRGKLVILITIVKESPKNTSRVFRVTGTEPFQDSAPRILVQD